MISSIDYTPLETSYSPAMILPEPDQPDRPVFASDEAGVSLDDTSDLPEYGESDATVMAGIIAAATR